MRIEQLLLKKPVPMPIMMIAMTKQAIAPLVSSPLLEGRMPGIAEMVKRMWPTMAIATPTQRVLKRPKYVSAIQAPKSGVT